MRLPVYHSWSAAVGRAQIRRGWPARWTGRVGFYLSQRAMLFTREHCFFSIQLKQSVKEPKITEMTATSGNSGILDTLYYYLAQSRVIPSADTIKDFICTLPRP